MELEKLQKIIAEVMNVDEEEITMDTTLWMIWVLTLWMYIRSSWALKKSLILRSRMKKLKRSFL